jgi:aspartyl-tRNA(Asn)/glutamyl-tRNA(Gln) amidotransferase subunit A
MIFKDSAVQLREKFAKGDVSARHIVEHFLMRIEKYDPSIGAFLRVTKERALRHAEALDKKRKEGKPLGKLAGVPFAIKDNIHVEGEISTCGSKILHNFKAPFSATAVRLLEEQDAIMIGKANLDEFAMGSSCENSAFKKTYNPWNLECSPGGSSGGSAAAVAARLAPCALGSDTGGSVRQPGSLCGVVGFKPTYGRVSRWGLVAYGSSLDQIGPLANSVEDVALLMEIIGQHCEKDSTSIPKKADSIIDTLSKPINGIKIGVPWQFLEGLSLESRKNFDEALHTLKGLGAEIVEVDLSILKYSLAVYYILATAEASTNLARFDGIRYGHRSSKAETLDEVYELSREEGFGPEVKRRILLGTFVLSSGYKEAYYRKAQKVRSLIIQKYEEAFSRCDLIATPVSPTPAFKVGSIKDPLQMYLEDIYTIGPNLSGIPSISVPSGFSKDGLPMGLQLGGPQLADANVIRGAYAFEQATRYNKKLPKGFDA